MTKRKRYRKSSKAANLQRRINMIANGMDQAGPNSPVFLVINKKLVKFSAKEYEKHVQEINDFLPNFCY